MPTPTKFVAGRVDDQGNPANQGDFTVARPTGGQPTTGRFIINFTPPFTTIFSVDVTQISKFPMGDTRDNAVVVDFNSSSANIITGKNDGTLENRSFSFIATGT